MPSQWVLQETGAAFVMNKKIAILVEKGVKYTGALGGDWQRIPFTAKGFALAATKAVEQLRSLAGDTTGKRGAT